MTDNAYQRRYNRWRAEHYAILKKAFIAHQFVQYLTADEKAEFDRVEKAKPRKRRVLVEEKELKTTP